MTALVPKCLLTKSDWEVLGTTKPEVKNYRNLRGLKNEGSWQLLCGRQQLSSKMAKKGFQIISLYPHPWQGDSQLLPWSRRHSFPTLESGFTILQALASGMEQGRRCPTWELGLKTQHPSWSPATTVSSSHGVRGMTDMGPQPYGQPALGWPHHDKLGFEGELTAYM